MLRQESYEKRKASEVSSENEWEEMANEVRGERNAEGGIEVTGEDLSELQFTQIGEDDLQTVADLESQLYSQDTLQYATGISYLEALLREPKAGEYSFMIEDKADEEQKPIGYCIAYETKSLSDPNFYGKSVYIADFGIVPEARKGAGTALRAFDELLNRTEANGIDMVEMEARESTSYRLFTSNLAQRLLARRGYVINDYGLSDDGWADGDKTYLLSLRKADQTKNKKAA